ncbi:MAG: prepilin-type N-terminal cleavage/methylation domain-containing protein [Gaiella sp.]
MGDNEISGSFWPQATGGDAMTRTARRLIDGEDGFTILELLVVLVILGILLAISVSSYLGFEQRASDRVAHSNLRAALPAVEAYYEDYQDYAGMTRVELKKIDAGLAPGVDVVSSSSSGYCLRSTAEGASVYRNGPGAALTSVACS